MITEFDARRAGHWALLRLAGRVPDGLLTTSRGLLAEGRYAEMARVITLAAAGRDLPLHQDDLRCIRGLLDGETGPRLLTGPLVGDPMPRHEFTAAEPFTAGVRSGRRADRLDRAAVAAVRAEPAARGVWRTWRVRAEGYREIAKPVFVVEVDARADAAGIAGRLQDHLTAEGELYPQAEVYEAGDWLPAYQRSARAASELLWAREPDPGVRIASLIDGFVGVGPGGWQDAEPVEDDAERDRLLAYLEAGTPVLITTARLHDVIDRERGRVVPMSFRTDGVWIWNDISVYYLRTYGFRPDDGLVAHIAANGYTIPQVDGVAEFRAISVLYRPEDEGATARR